MQRVGRIVLTATILGVVAYVATWFVLGLVAPGHDPLRDAISQLFALDQPPLQRWAMTLVLGVTGAVLLPVGVVLDRVLPGQGRLGVWLTTLAALGTLLVTLVPCTAGCPGVGASTTDTLHAVVAGAGYVGLVTAPLAWAWRLRGTDERGLALLGLALGGLATVGFLVRSLAGVDVLGGLQQRVFNTAADLWFVAAAVRGRALLDAAPVRRAGPPAAPGRAGPGR